jgi:hypothetical protein
MKSWAQDAHETGQHHQPRLAGVDALHQCQVELFARGEITMTDCVHRNAGGARPRQSRGAGFVADDGADLGRQAAVAHGIDDGLQVAAAARDQDHDAGPILIQIDSPAALRCVRLVII